MKKSSFIALILGTVSGVLFSLGMCMALIPEWDAFREGVVFGVIGGAMGIITIMIWRKMAGRRPVKLSGKKVLFSILGIAGALILGLGMCFCLVWEKFIPGTLIGLLGIVMLISLIPITKGIK